MQEQLRWYATALWLRPEGEPVPIGALAFPDEPDLLRWIDELPEDRESEFAVQGTCPNWREHSVGLEAINFPIKQVTRKSVEEALDAPLDDILRQVEQSERRERSIRRWLTSHWTYYWLTLAAFVVVGIAGGAAKDAELAKHVISVVQKILGWIL